MKLPLKKILLLFMLLGLLTSCNKNYTLENVSYKPVMNYKNLGVLNPNKTKTKLVKEDLECNVLLNNQRKLMGIFDSNIENYISILSCQDNKIIISNKDNIMTLKQNGEIFTVHNLMNLKEMITDEISDKREILLSPNNNYLIYSNIIEKDNRKNIYFCNLTTNKGILIGEHNIIDIIDDWSSNSNYYVYADKEGSEIFIFDVKENIVTKIGFNKENIKEIYITDDGNLYVKGNKKYYISKNDKYSISEIIIQGNLLGCKGEKLLYFYAGDIFEYENGKTEKLSELGKGYNVVTNNCNKSVFSNENDTIIYNYDNNTSNKYGFKYEYLNYMLINDISNKVLISSERYNTRIVGSNGQYYRVDHVVLSEFIGKCKWFNDKYILKIIFDKDKKNFSIIRLNVEDSSMNIIFKNYSK